MDPTLKRNVFTFACVAAVAAGLTAVFAFGVPLRSVLLVGMVALCPLMHLFMGHGHGGHQHADEPSAGEHE